MEIVPYELHVVSDGDAWRVLENGTEPSQNVYATRDEAEEHAMNLAEAAGYGEIILHDENNLVVHRYQYQSAA